MDTVAGTEPAGLWVIWNFSSIELTGCSDTCWVCDLWEACAEGLLVAHESFVVSDLGKNKSVHFSPLFGLEQDGGDHSLRGSNTSKRLL